MGASRAVCVALPLILTIASICTLLYAVLAGVTHENLRLIRLNVTDLSIDPAKVNTIADKLGIGARDDVKVDNITTADLGLGNLYDMTLWGYCRTESDGKRNCTKHEFDWATKNIIVDDLRTGSVTIQLPKEIKDALKAFREVTKWAEVAYVVALIALGVELFIGLFSNFSRVISCLTWLESTIATILVFAAAGFSTAMAAIVVGAVDSTAKFYGVHASLDKSFLVFIWLAAAFALGASLFWIFTICCCKPDRGSRKARGPKHVSNDGEKLLPGSGFGSRGYAPLDNEHEMTSNDPYKPTQPRFAAGSGRSDLAYEPYSHRA